jgi:hemerythrin-like metal-binding protein
MNDTATDPTIAWKDSLLLGDPAMDGDHREFIELLHRVQTAADADLAPRFRAFAHHAREHFVRENGWMTDSGFPPRQCHIDEHDAVLKSVDEVLALMDAGDLAVVRRLADHMAGWFPAHLQHLDSAVVHWLSKQRFGGKPIVLRRSAAGDPASTPTPAP